MKLLFKKDTKKVIIIYIQLVRRLNTSIWDEWEYYTE